jgi:hypothetical protein
MHVSLSLRCLHVPLLPSRRWQVAFLNSHSHSYLPGGIHVLSDELLTVEADSTFRTTHFDATKLRLNHYWSRSEAYLLKEKMHRRTSGTVGAEDSRRYVLAVADIYDRTLNFDIVRYVPEVRRRLGIRSNVEAEEDAKGEFARYERAQLPGRETVSEAQLEEEDARDVAALVMRQAKDTKAIIEERTAYERSVKSKGNQMKRPFV